MPFWRIARNYVRSFIIDLQVACLQIHWIWILPKAFIFLEHWFFSNVWFALYLIPKWYNKSKSNMDLTDSSYFSLLFNLFQPSVVIKSTPVIWFGLRIKWLISIWHEKIGWNELIDIQRHFSLWLLWMNFRKCFNHHVVS